MTDMLLIFPPQWSPFQPALSLPSLSAWLKRAGFGVRSLDLNVAFYEWLLSDECAALLADQLDGLDWDHEAKRAYRTIFESVATFRDDLQHLKTLHGQSEQMPPDDYVRHNYLAIKSLETYLHAVSNVSQSFTISPYEFRLDAGNLRVAELERRVAAPAPLLERFVRRMIAEQILPAQAKVIGLSCIGQEQLYFTLLFGALLKEQTDTPIVVGGTIFSRIFERGALRPEWFERYFDIIVRNEGEKPAERLLANLRDGRPLTEDVPGIVYRDGALIASATPCGPLGVAELPIPDFDDLPLDRYISPEITLPLLSARGCYWGKCEFCHHGMVYGEKYAPYDAGVVLDTVRTLAARYNVKHFAFNDEALPPKTGRAIGTLFPPHAETGWTFTGLIKFEPFYTSEIFAGMHSAGFRSLYVGLESASERVLDLMRKNSKRETIVGNLRDATRAGIWMHCFLFFGFPGETEAEARETFDFIVQNPEIVSSFGAGTFSLEHNAPIFHHVEDFGVEVRVINKNDVDVYYAYDVADGITAERALEWQEQLSEATATIPNYAAAKWVPRELLLCMLSAMSHAELRRTGLSLRRCGELPASASLAEIATRAVQPPDRGETVVINRINGRALVLKNTAAKLFDFCYDHDVSVEQLRTEAPALFEKLAFVQDRELALVGE